MGPRPHYMPTWKAAADFLDVEAIRQERTYAELSEEIGSPKQSVGRWLSRMVGARFIPKADAAWDLARVLGYDIVFVPRKR